MVHTKLNEMYINEIHLFINQQKTMDLQISSAIRIASKMSFAPMANVSALPRTVPCHDQAPICLKTLASYI